jgi:hypothetical protein
MSMLEMLGAVLGGDTRKQMSRKIGADEGATGAALAAVLPAILGGLTRNASRPDGARSLHDALAKDHDGSALDRVRDLINDPDSGPGDGILGHVFGNRRQNVERNIGRSTGLDAGSIAQLMKMAAPLVMGALGKTQRSSHLDAGGLSSMLDGERRRVEREAPKEMGMLGRLLDADGDGDVDLGDLAKHGLGALGKFFR